MSRQTDDNLINWNQTGFSDGLVKNAPHEDLPAEAVAGLVNAHCHRTEIQPRLASWLWSELQPPPWKDDCENERSEYTLSKSKDIVSSEDGVFDQSFVSCYIAWPEDNGFYHDEITEYLSENRVRVSLSGNRDLTSGCYIHGRLNINDWHKKSRIKIWQIGRRVYTSPIDYSRLDECLCVSRRMPSNVISSWDEMDEHGLIGNSNGIFKVNFDSSIGILWRMNGPVPSVLLSGKQRRKEDIYRYDYIYSMAKIAGAGIRDRTTAKILQQSGTTQLNLDVIPNRDYSTYWTDKPIGNNDSSTKIGCKLTCGRISEAHKNPSYYRTIPLPGASFKFTHNDYEAEFIIDFSKTGAFVQNMKEVAQALQDGINTLFPWIGVKYYDEGYFEFNTGQEKHTTIGYLSAGTSGTDISQVLKGTQDDGATIDDKWSNSGPNKVGIYTIPKDQGYYEWHWTHYTKWRTTDISENGADPRTTRNCEEIELPPLKFTWAGDFRVAAAFYASKSGNIITAEIGTFEKADEGTPYKWEDGDVDTIAEYISPRKVRIEADYYYGDVRKPLQAGAIGGGRVLRASQSGNIVTLETIYNNDYFSRTECDARKTIFWSNGYESIITEVLSDGSLRVHDNATRETQGITIDPTCRVISDITTDETLRNRMDEKHTGLLNMRYKVPLPNCNILCVIPGFIITAKRGDTIAPYCDLGINAKYSAGYYLESRQVLDNINGFIQFIKKAPNYFLIWCSGSLHGGPTNVSDIIELPEFGEYYSVLHSDVIDEYLGAVDWGSINEVNYGIFELICHDMSVRQLINKKYGDDLTYNNVEQDIIAKDLKECWNIGSSAYGKTLGHVFWRTLK